jgi:hypothetical protein
MFNTNWGGVVENNFFGTQAFLEFCDKLGSCVFPRLRPVVVRVR